MNAQVVISSRPTNHLISEGSTSVTTRWSPKTLTSMMKAKWTFLIFFDDR